MQQLYTEEKKNQTQKPKKNPKPQRGIRAQPTFMDYQNMYGFITHKMSINKYVVECQVPGDAGMELTPCIMLVPGLWSWAPESC